MAAKHYRYERAGSCSRHVPSSSRSPAWTGFPPYHLADGLHNMRLLEAVVASADGKNVAVP
jgi:hypothetical protein